MMKQESEELVVSTRGRGFHEVTEEVQRWVARSGIETGLLTIFIQHTSASLLIQENADPEVKRDFERFFGRLIPDGDPLLEHDYEGPDDMPAHIRTALTSVHLCIPVAGGRAVLGTWQGIYVWEHRTHGHRRRVKLHLMGEGRS